MAGTVTIRLASSDGSDDDIRRLARWLRDEDELRAHVALRNAPVNAGEMGALTEAVVVAVSGGGAASLLVTSLFGWLTNRRDARRVTLTVESSSGKKIDLSCGSADDAERILRVCENTLDEAG